MPSRGRGALLHESYFCKSPKSTHSKRRTICLPVGPLVPSSAHSSSACSQVNPPGGSGTNGVTNGTGLNGTAANTNTINGAAANNNTTATAAATTAR
jgi:hypothetical protein